MKTSDFDRATTLAQRLLNPITLILKRLLPDYAEAQLKDDQTRNLIVKQADALLLAEVPAAALIPQSARQRLIRRVLDWLLDDLLLPETKDAQPSAALVFAGSTDMRTPDADAADGGEQKKSTGTPLGVRSITVQLTANADETEIKHAAESVVPAWEVQKLDDELPGFYTLRPPRDMQPTVSEAWDLAYRLSGMPGIEQAEPAIRQLPDVPEKTQPPAGVAAAGVIDFVRYFGMQDHDVSETKTNAAWSLELIDAEKVWTDGNEGLGVFIGHVDTGYTRHPEILQNIRADLGYDTWDDDPNPLDDLDPSLWDAIRSKMPVANPGHGTATASVIASPRGWQTPQHGPEPVCGAAPRASIIPIRATPSVVILPTGSLEEVARGILKAVHSGAKVISMSLGSPWGARELELAVQTALDRGVIVCAAAGNVVLAESWLTAVTYPAAYPGVIAVAGCDYHGRPWRDSCRGKEVVITAPGTDVWRATAEGKGALWWSNIVYSTGQGSGTSFAVATVAGIAACWLNYWGGWEQLLKEFGGKGHEREIPEAFLACLRQHKATSVNIPSSKPQDLEDYPHFDSRDFGRGIINVPELLKVDPRQALAQASSQPAAAAVSQDDTPEILFELQRQFGVNLEELTQVLSDDLGVQRDALPEFLRQYGRELLHHVAASTSIRSRLYHQLTRARHLPSAHDGAAATIAAAPFSEERLDAQLILRGSHSLAEKIR